MRLNSTNNQFKVGGIRGKRQWMVLGLALGIIAALALDGRTGWIVRKEISTGLPLARTLDDAVLREEFESYGVVDKDTLAASAKVAKSSGNDVPIQIACDLFREEAAVSQRLGPRMGNPTIFDAGSGTYNSEIQLAINPVKETVLRNVCRKYPNSPEAYAAYINVLVESGIKSDRPEGYWISGQSAPKNAEIANPSFRTGNSYSPIQSADHKTSETAAAMEAKILQANRILALENASMRGLQADPQNAFFGIMLAYAHCVEHEDSKVLHDIDVAAHAKQFNDYSFELARGWQRLDTALYGPPDSTVETSRYEGGLNYRCVMQARSVGQVVIWKAIELEHHGHIREGLVLRMRVAAVGAAISRYRPNGYFNGASNNLVDMSAEGAGGVLLSRHVYNTQSDNEPQYEYANRCSKAYMGYLQKHGFTAEAAWYKPIFKAQYKRASSEYYAQRSLSDNDNNLAQKISPVTVRAVGYWTLGEITLMVFIGLALGLATYRRRFTRVSEVYWSRPKWGAAIGGCLLAVFCLIAFTLMADIQANPWPLAGAVLVAIGITQLILRRTSVSDSPTALFANSVCVIACLFIAAGISGIGVHSFLAGSYGQYYREAPFLTSTIPFGLALIVLPAFILFVVAVICRVQYKGVPSGMFNGTRRAIVPVISALLVIWAVNVAVTAGIEKDLRLSLCESLGLKSEDALK